jgi:D-ribose pyranose/furanose isomerase RbsD
MMMTVHVMKKPRLVHISTVIAQNLRVERASLTHQMRIHRPQNQETCAQMLESRRRRRLPRYTVVD